MLYAPCPLQQQMLCVLTFTHPNPFMKNQPRAISQSFDFEHLTTEPGELVPVLERLIQEATGRLGDYHCRRVSVRLYDHRQSSPRVMTRLLTEPTANTSAICRGARLQLEALLSSQPSVYRLGLELAGLTPSRKRPGLLFFQRLSVNLRRAIWVNSSGSCSVRWKNKYK